jgi:phospho-N-acetylmuramoyl-pentapeptide-transferase
MIQFTENPRVVSALIESFGFALLAFVLGIVLTPLLTNFLYKNKLGKNIRESSMDQKDTPVFTKYHAHKQGTPTMAGILFWGITAFLTLIFNLTRDETFLPLFFLIAGGILGAIDDLANIKGIGKIKGLGAKLKLTLQMLIAGFGAYWFTYKLEWTSFHVPGGHLIGLPENIELGVWYAPIFALIVIYVMNSVDITDGLDGLLAGSIIPSFAGLAVVAFMQEDYSLTTFITTLIGSLVAFLWFNIHPARFFMGGTGAFALGAVLASVAMLTDAIVVLPLFGLLFIIEGLSSLLQTFSKRFFGRKIFRAAPIHHHFQAVGWEETKIVMRFWIISAMASICGLIIALLGL